ncbi:MAG TPA: fumarylacetoacetate hydrolase family protein [bacterium]|jgi:2-keto-4-pentenoate hydratase/2-oxohepta-3-ene-1,7-dioic acid hydratase in catechol pathway|nr:fumarylacetoacetate hydrolase family protein [bacterium]
MRIGSYLAGDRTTWGVIDPEGAIDAPPLLAAAGLTAAADLRAFLARGGTASQLASAIRQRDGENARRPIGEVRLLAPIPNPSKIVCMGLNFEDYRRILGLEYLAVPQLFLKAPSAVVGPDAVVEIPEGYGSVFHEFEVGAVIGRRIREVSEAEAEGAIFGYTIVNDLVLHDVELLTREYQQWAKNCDTFAPMGPWIATPDEVPVDRARMIRRRNGTVEAESSMGQMRRGMPEMIAFVTTFMTLEPGDLVTSASPPAGPFNPGDVLEVEVEGIGVLRNRVVGRRVAREYAHALGL